VNSYRLKSLVTSPVKKSDGELLPFVGLEDVGPGTGALATDELPMKAALDSVLHRPGDVLFSKLRPYLAKSFMPTMPGSATGELLVLRPGRKIDGRFLLYSTLSSPWLELAETTSYGTKMPRTSWEAMSEYRLLLPPLDDQRRIVGFLDIEISKIDTLISLRSLQANKLEEHEASWRSQLFLASKSGVWIKVKHLLRSKPRYGVLVPEFADSGVPFIRVANLSDIANRTRLATIPYELSAQYGRTVTMIDDVLITVVGGTIGKAAIVPEDLAGANVARAIAVLRLNPEHASSLFTTWVETPEFMRQVRLATEADSAQPTLGMEDLANFSVRWPADYSEERVMTQIARERQLDTATVHATLNRQLALLTERRQALITAAVTGGITV
jgi:type I restriction enzyme S subunit